MPANAFGSIVTTKNARAVPCESSRLGSGAGEGTDGDEACTRVTYVIFHECPACVGKIPEHQRGPPCCHVRNQNQNKQNGKGLRRRRSASAENHVC